MSMPDLDPDEAGFCAYWNVIEQGGLPASELDWSEVLNNGNINSYKLADNGVIIDYYDWAWPGLTVRLKTDGWMVAYNDTTVGYDGEIVDVNESGLYGESIKQRGVAPEGPINIVYWWEEPGWEEGLLPDGLHKNRFARAIASLQGSLSTSSQINFNYSDVGFYDFIDGSDAISVFSEAANETSHTRDVNVLSGTTINSCQILGMAFGNATYAGGDVDVNGNYFLSVGSSDGGYKTRDHTSFLENDESVTLRVASSNQQAFGAVAVTWSEVS